MRAVSLETAYAAGVNALGLENGVVEDVTGVVRVIAAGSVSPPPQAVSVRLNIAHGEILA